MTHTYLAFELDQKPAAADAPKLYMFHAPAKEILSWAAIDRLSKQSPSGIQRPSTRARVLGVERFFKEDRNVTPTAIVVAIDGATTEAVANYQLTSGVTVSDSTKVVQITIPDATATKPAVLLDGQHRLLGAEEWNPETRLAVVALLDVDINEKAFQFLVINNKAAKVSPDHIRAMLHGAEYDEKILESRLDSVRLNVQENTRSVRVMDIDPESPFKGMIKWPHNLNSDGAKPVQEGFIPPAAIEVAIESIAVKKIKDLQDDETVDEFFIALWSEIKEQWPQVFSAQKVSGSNLLTKVGIICLTEFLVSRLRDISMNKRTQFSMGDPDKVRGETKELLDTLSAEFWTSEWRSTSYDTRAGRDQIIAALDAIRGNIDQGRDWYFEVSMVIPPGTGIDDESDEELA